MYKMSISISFLISFIVPLILILFKAWVVIIQIQSKQNWVAIVVSFMFLLSDIANWALFVI